MTPLLERLGPPPLLLELVELGIGVALEVTMPVDKVVVAALLVVGTFVPVGRLDVVVTPNSEVVDGTLPVHIRPLSQQPGAPSSSFVQYSTRRM